MSSFFRLPKKGAQPKRRSRRSCSGSRALAEMAFVVAVLGVVLVGCSGSSDGGGTAKLPEAYPGVISPVDVGPQPPPAPGLDGRALTGLPMQKKVEYLVGKYGVDSVAAMVFEGCPPNTADRVRQRVLRAAASNNEYFSRGKDDRTVGYLAPVTDLEGFAARLDIGEVTVDSPKRVVLVKVDAAKLAAEVAAKPPRMASLPHRKRERPPRKPSWHFFLQQEFPPDSVLVTVRGADARIAEAIVEYVRQKNPTLDVSRHELAGQTCVFVCGGVEDIEILGERLDLGTVAGTDAQDARLDVTFDLARVMRSAGPGAAARFDPNSVEWALEELKSGESQVRFWALKRVQQTLPSEPLRGQVVEAMKALLHGDDQSLRRDAIGTLAVWGSAEVVPDLVELLEDPDILVRQEAIRALGQLNDEQAIEPLCGLLGTEHEAERALIGMGPAVEDAVLASLDPNNERQFRAACEVLCQVGTQKSLQKLGPFYLRRMGPLHSAATGAVNGIRRRGQAAGVEGIDVVAAALENLKSNEPHEIRSACDLLARSQPDPQRREEVARALVHAAGYPDELVRFTAVNALVVWHTPETFPEVVKLTKDDRAQIRHAAIRMLGQMKTKAAIEVLLDCFPRDTHRVVEALTAIGPSAEGPILRRMDSPPMRDMNQAYSLLCKIGTEKCVKKLREVSSEPPNLENQSRRFAALMALGWWEQFGSAAPQDQGQAGETATLADDAATTEAKPRTWTDSTGQFKVEATLLGLKDGQVTLKRTDGRVVALSLERLCQADQEFVKKATAKPRN